MVSKAQKLKVIIVGHNVFERYILAKRVSKVFLSIQRNNSQVRDVLALSRGCGRLVKCERPSLFEFCNIFGLKNEDYNILSV